jgi:hypothetical protein
MRIEHKADFDDEGILVLSDNVKGKMPWSDIVEIALVCSDEASILVICSTVQRVAMLRGAADRIGLIDELRRRFDDFERQDSFEMTRGVGGVTFGLWSKALVGGGD